MLCMSSSRHLWKKIMRNDEIHMDLNDDLLIDWSLNKHSGKCIYISKNILIFSRGKCIEWFRFVCYHWVARMQGWVETTPILEMLEKLFSENFGANRCGKRLLSFCQSSNVVIANTFSLIYITQSVRYKY